MADATDILNLPFPDLDGSDTADVPRDINALAVAIEELLIEGGPLWGPGDIKFSAQTDDHGRWLLLDGRELTQAEIETELSLTAGQAADLVTLLGTGASSKYGTAASGKVILPDMRDKMPMGLGTSHPAKGTGSAGGVETVTLTAGQSGIRSHTHGITDAGHSHGVTDPGHAHGASSSSVTPTISVNSGSTGITASTDSKQPTITASADYKTPTITASADYKTPTIYINDPGHVHAGGGANFFRTDTFSGTAIAASGSGTRFVTTADTPSATTGITSKQDAHTHTITASQDAHTHTITATQAAHNHAVTVTDPGHTHTLSYSAHSHTITVSSTTTGLTVNSASTGISVNNVSSAAATDAHDNMPPYRTLGSAFMRV